MTAVRTADAAARAPGYSLLALPRFRRNPLEMLLRATREHGDVVRFSFGPVQLHLVSAPEDVAHVLVDNHRGYDKQAVGYGKLRLALGDSLMTADGDAWRKRRRIVQPAFHRDQLRRFASVVTEATERRIAAWTPGEAVDIVGETMALTLDIICRAMFSMDASAEAAHLGELMTTAIRWINDRMMAITSIFDFPDRLPFPKNRRFHAAIAEGDALVLELIERRTRSGEDPGDLLSMLLSMRDAETGGGLTPRELRNEIITVFAAGHETTANALAWTFHLLAANPDAEAPLFDEIDRVLGARPATLEDVRSLPVTTAILKEALRLYPPAWLLSRRAIADDCLGGYRIPAGSAVLLSPWVTQRRPDVFDRPEAFLPERFLGAEPPRLSFFPFGGGPRLCVGKEVAMAELILVLATIARRYRLVRDGDGRLEPEALVTLRPSGHLRLVPRPR